jgi:replication initiation and membrane attachment protein DnaB
MNIDLDRLQQEFEKISINKRGNGKTLHVIVRALEETDLGSNVLILYNFNLYYGDWLRNYICSIAQALGYKYKIKNKNSIILDNGKIIKWEYATILNKPEIVRRYSSNEWVILQDWDYYKDFYDLFDKRKNYRICI